MPPTERENANLSPLERFMEIEGGYIMPERKTLERVRKDAAEGQAPSTQAGEFVREEIHHVRGTHRSVGWRIDH